jgi:hypothetical protein
VPLFAHFLFLVYAPHFHIVPLETHLVQIFLSLFAFLPCFCIARFARNEAVRCAKKINDAPAA